MSKHIKSSDHPTIDIIQATSDLKLPLSDIEKLLQQLTQGTITFTAEDYQNIISSPDCRLYLAIDSSEDKKIIGMVALVHFRVPTGIHARIEDLVVDQNYRGRGIGEKLMQTAIRSVKNSRAIHLELTSNAQRVAANRLYQKLDFKLINTNVYRLYLQ